MPVEIKDPRLLTTSKGPWIVMSDNLRDPIARLIDWRTHLLGYDAEDHAMLSINPGEFVWESMTLWHAYKEAPMDSYLVPGGTLKFVSFVNSNPDFVKAFSKSVQKRLTRPAWQNMYDFLGIFGQAIGCPNIHMPGLEFCSVDVIRHSVNACPFLPKADQVVINSIPRQANPELLWKIILSYPQTFSVDAYWSSLTGVIV